jgi:hypothetical protein
MPLLLAAVAVEETVQLIMAVLMQVAEVGVLAV